MYRNVGRIVKAPTGRSLTHRAYNDYFLRQRYCARRHTVGCRGSLDYAGCTMDSQELQNHNE
jgi:hypothetical protein